MKKIIPAVIALVVWQDTFSQGDSLRSNQLDEVVVTATKSPKKMSETGKLVAVITKEQIMQSAGKDLAQLLNEQTGVTVNGANSNPGKDKSLFLLGATDKYTLILLDGIPLNEPAGVGGSFDLRLLSLDNIERIEILKGSQSTLYGSNAVAGVINIISKKAVSEKPLMNGLVTYGSYNSLKGNATIGQKTKRYEYSLNYVHYTTDGISEAKDTTGSAGFDKDGFTQNAIQTMATFNITERLKVAPYYRFSQFKGGYDDDAFTDAPDHYTASLVNTGVSGRYAYKTGTVYFDYGYDFTKREYADRYGDFLLKGKFHNAEAFVNENIGNHMQLVAGLDYQSYRMDVPDTVNSILSTYASFLLHGSSGWNIEMGGRFNHHNQYGNNFTYSFNPSFLLHERVKLFVNLTSGFRAPSIGELFGPYGANPRLKPEKSNSQETGIQASLIGNKLSMTADGFNRVIDDVIIYGSNGYENRDRQHDFGAELELRYAISAQLNVQAAYAYIDGSITQKLAGKDTTFYNLIRRPKHAVHLTAGYQVSKALFVSTSLQFAGKRTDTYYDPATFVPSEVSLKAYAIWNAYVAYRFLKNRAVIFADAKNLMNKTNYYEIYGYNVQGFNLTAGLRFTL